MVNRCHWVHLNSQISLDYHDQEWGVPITSDRGLFECLCLEILQAGLSWHTVLQKRSQLRAYLAHFDASQLAYYNEADVASLLANPQLIRHRGKLAALIANAQALLTLQARWGSFSHYVWRFVAGVPQDAQRGDHQDRPEQTQLGHQMAQAFKQAGFRWVGPTVCYAFMQAAGLVNDHSFACFRYAQINQQFPTLPDDP
jgi:DNA-3-methyladenine glycosylase I